MNQAKRKCLFKRNETGYHTQAVKVLARWVKGKREVPFMVNGFPLFVPDIVCYENGVLKYIYEVVYSHPLTGRKLGLIEYWCYRNSTSVIVYEVSADYILKQICKPEFIQTMECYIIDPLEDVKAKVLELCDAN